MEGFNGKYLCIKDYYPGEFLTKDKIYEFKEGTIEYDSIIELYKYATFEDYCKRNCTLSECLIPYKEKMESAKSLADVIMTHLGLEEGQKFKIGSGTGTHYFEGGKLMVIVGDEAPRKSLLPLNRFLQETVQPVQWEPKPGDWYYKPSYGDKRIERVEYKGDEFDSRVLKICGKFCRTGKEALELEKELGW